MALSVQKEDRKGRVRTKPALLADVLDADASVKTLTLPTHHLIPGKSIKSPCVAKRKAILTDFLSGLSSSS